MTPEQRARAEIDRLLGLAGWAVQSGDAVDLHAARGMAVREFPLNPGAYEYDELVVRDKASLDIFWLRDETLADSDNLPPPDVIAQETVDDLEAALEQFRLIAGDLAGERAA